MSVIKTKPQIVAEILPDRKRAVIAAVMALVAVTTSLYFLNTFFAAGPLKDFMQSPSQAFDKFGPSTLLLLIFCGLLWSILGSAWRLAVTLRINPTPRIRITENGFEIIHFWRTHAVAWPEFGRFAVEKKSDKEDSTVHVKALAPTSQRTGGEEEILSFELKPFMPLMRVNVGEGERLAQWIVDLRAGRKTLPPDSLTVRMLKRSMTTATQTVARQ